MTHEQGGERGGDGPGVGEGAGSVVTVRVVASPLTAWFHHLLTRPVVVIDGREYAARWGRRATRAGKARVAPGTHRLCVAFRYRGQRTARLGESCAEFTAGGTPLGITARLGARNGSRFRIGEPVAHEDGRRHRGAPARP
ncbi:hypothetical protein [Streptomyces pinistramenti]|uniref:hypothetical protein n=1 Tax=Streptomyces pinistramenti TaxID=2884812 RepID=UPI001D07E906|nr:hypothetical protein [Streptomyces pinistramenti]MCB5908223.1 hypothetical protein [Streptomyces pinistramenti]